MPFVIRSRRPRSPRASCRACSGRSDCQPRPPRRQGERCRSSGGRLGVGARIAAACGRGDPGRIARARDARWSPLLERTERGRKSRAAAAVSKEPRGNCRARSRHRGTAGRPRSRLTLINPGYWLDMTASQFSQAPGEPVELDADEIEPEGIARVIYVAPVALAVERAHRRRADDA
jgi:hypothetical protein